ncbi:uncharacterized protein LOC127801307 [Diospyros lotus]|uniref:uncharacterized protein LOC127801307 n=1 Tax=Diospyros lotus TaxID=55363 RepID=UPI0022538735|nr:uncharacterized protein LOC127801307 [Diospyros lotus]XP_052192241.1 uncharacterized protein LOC127801307 [Diospyros lotus]
MVSAKTGHHARSISLPSILHPLIPQFNEHSSRLRASEATSSSLSPSIRDRLESLQGLYGCVDDLLLLPHTQQAFSEECNKRWGDEALDGCLNLLDVCAVTKEIFSQAKQGVQELLPICKRRNIGNDLERSLASRTKAKKMIQKSLRDLKILIRSKNRLISLNKGQTAAIFSMLKAVELASLAMFESLMSYAAGTRAQSRPTNWSLASKLMMHHKNVVEMNEFEKLDAALSSLFLDKKIKSDCAMNIEKLENHLGKME